MANHVTNRIRIVGNESVKDFCKIIIRALNEDLEMTNDYGDTTSLQRVFESTPLKNIFPDFDGVDIGPKWAFPEGRLEEYDDLRFISAWDPLVGLQNYLLLCTSKTDPLAVVDMEYDDETPNFCGYRVILNIDGTIIEFSEFLDTQAIKVVSEAELEEAKAENDESEEFEEVITWDEFWGLLADLKARVLEEAIKNGPSSHRPTIKLLL